MILWYLILFLNCKSHYACAHHTYLMNLSLLSNPCFAMHSHVRLCNSSIYLYTIKCFESDFHTITSGFLVNGTLATNARLWVEALRIISRPTIELGNARACVSPVGIWHVIDWLRWRLLASLRELNNSLETRDGLTNNVNVRRSRALSSAVLRIEHVNICPVRMHSKTHRPLRNTKPRLT